MSAAECMCCGKNEHLYGNVPSRPLKEGQHPQERRRNDSMVGISPDDDRSSVRIKTAWTPGPNPPKMEHPARVSNSQLQKLANNDDRTSVSIKTAWNPGPNPPKMHPHPAGEGRANVAYTDSIWRQAWRLFCVCCGAQESHTTEERQVYGNFRLLLSGTIERISARWASLGTAVIQRT